MWRVSAILLLLVVPEPALAGPVAQPDGSNNCARRCPDSVKLQYEPGNSYEYQYEAETQTTMSGAAQDTATILLTATARIDVLDRCEMALWLTDVGIKRSHEQKSERIVAADDMSLARSALEDRPLRFAFYDGTIGDLCPDDDDNTWALNVKRGVLSSFQNSMNQMDREEHLRETDVVGLCPTHYKVTQKGWKKLTINKVKDVMSCSDRFDYRSSLLSVPYSVPNTLQSLPLMKSSHECTHDISKDNSILQRSSCHEMHVFRPFSKATSGAMTEASQTLTFVRKSSRITTQKDSIGRRTTLLFEHKQGSEMEQSAFSDVKKMLRKICEITKEDIRPEVPNMYGDLTNMMKNLDYSDLQMLQRQLRGKNFCPDNAEKTLTFFRDALPVTSTGASLRMMSELLISGEIRDQQATFWLTSLAFIPNPTKDMISAVEPLLANDKTQEDAFLSVSSLVHNYCERVPTCTQDTEVRSILDILIKILDSDCSVRDNNFKQIMLTLRALGNIGHLENAGSYLNLCFGSDKQPTDVRVAALDAYRRQTCADDRSDAMSLFLRTEEDAEVRIAAYLAVMQCPTEEHLNRVRQTLQDEGVNQVGSFVWTHLTNLLETQSPHKQAIRDVLENDLLQKEFSKDRRKYSRNTELSFFSDKFNLGGVYENNIIWSTNSFIPRSAMMNLTVDMFGHSVNLLEVGVRVQGLEYLLQSYFGPDTDKTGKEGGYGRTNVVKNEKMARIKKMYGEVKDDLRAQGYMRVFGNELAFGMLDGNDVKKLRDGKPRSFLDDLLKKLTKDGQVAFTHSSKFMDTTMIIPTAVGLPLNLSVNGLASLDFQASRKMDFKKINAKSKAFEVAAMLQPSGAVELSSTMSVDAFVTKVGLKMTSRLHTSTSVKGRVELARGQTLSVEIDTPRDTLELFDFQSKFFIVHDSHEKEQKMIEGNRKERTFCTSKAVTEVTGMALCASLSFPNATTALNAPYFPFTGPTSISLTLQKHDAHSGYRLLAKQTQTSSSMITQVALDTPGSTADRAVSLAYVLNLKKKTFDADLLSPWKKVSTKMSVAYNRKMYKASAMVRVDSDKEYKVEAQLDRDIRDRKDLIVKLKPSLQVTALNESMLSVTGDLDYREGKAIRTSVEVEMKTLKKPISFTYTMTMRGKPGKMRYKNNVKLSSQFATVKGTLQALVGTFSAKKRSALLTIRSRMDYHLHAFPRIKKNLINMGLKLHDRSTASLRKYGISVNVDAKKTPYANLLLNGEFSHKKTLTEMEMKVRHGKNVKLQADKSKEMVVAGFVAHKLTDSAADVRFDLKTVYPEKDIEYQLKGKHEHNKKNLEDYVSVRYAKGKSVDTHLRMSTLKKKRTVALELSYPDINTYIGRDMKLTADFTEKDDRHHLLTVLASPQKGQKNSLVVSFKRPTDNSVEISSDMNLHQQRPIKLDISGNYSKSNMAGKGKLTLEGQTYSLNYTSDIVKDKYARFTMNFMHPERTISALLEGGKDEEDSVKRAKVAVLWDANNDPSQKAGVTLELADNLRPEDMNIGGMVEVFTPVEKYHHLKAQLRLENSNRQILTMAETVLGEDPQKYSAKFMLKKPVTKENLNTQVWLKTPHRVVRHVEVKVVHSFADSGKLSTTVKGVMNRDFVEAGLSGSSKGDLVVRILEGAAFFKSSIPDAESFHLSFNHRDSNGRYNSQTVLDANGDQYSATMDANFQKIHLQITTDGDVSIRAPQLSSPVRLEWQHKNSLHELSSTITLHLPEDQQVQFDVEASANIVSNQYKTKAQLRGPWKENGAEHTSKLKMDFQYSDTSFDLAVVLKLEQDTYTLTDTLKEISGGYQQTSAMTSTKYPEYDYQHTAMITYTDFPYLFSVAMTLGGKPHMNLDVEIENSGRKTYISTSRVVFYFIDGPNNFAVKATHKKNRLDQWVTKGKIDYQVDKPMSFNSVLDINSHKKIFNLDVDTPFTEVRNVRLQYSHSGNIEDDFTASCSLSVDPQFETLSSEISWNNGEQFRGSIRVDTPFEEMRYFELKTQSLVEDNKRHTSVILDHSPKQVYKVHTILSEDFSQHVFVTLNVTTPRKELPSLHTHLSFQNDDRQATGKLVFIGPPAEFDRLSTTLIHSRSPTSSFTQVDTVIGAGNTWSTVTDLNWGDDIDCTLRVENTAPEVQDTRLLLSHRGQSWEDFRTKASFRMNGDRLESEVAYSNKNGRSGLFMLATPDPDIDFFKTTFFQKRSEDKFEGEYTAQYGENAKPFHLGLTTVYSDDKIGFISSFKTPHSEDLDIEIGFSGKRRVEMKVYGQYGSNDKLDTLIKYNIKKEVWDVGCEFEYLIQGSGREIGLTFRRQGPLDNLKCTSTGKYMGKRVAVEVQYKDSDKKWSRVNVRTNFKDYTNLTAAFDHTGDSENFVTNVYLKYKDNKEAKGTVNFQRNKWKRVVITSTFNTPHRDFLSNEIKYKHTYRKNKLAAETSLKFGQEKPIKGEFQFLDNRRLTVSASGPYKDFESLTASGTFDKVEKRLEGDATIRLISQQTPITASYDVRAGIWPVMVNVQAQTPFDGWNTVEFTTTHDGGLTDFTSSHSLTADAVGRVRSEMIWSYTSPAVLDGLWTLSSTIEGAENLKLAMRNTQTGYEYSSQLTVGWDLLKEIIVDTTVDTGIPPNSDNRYRGSVGITTPFAEASQLSLSFEHSHNDRNIQHSAVAKFNDKTYLDADFDYSFSDRHLGSIEFREPQPMEFLLGGRLGEKSMEGELKLNWDKRSPEMNIHLTGEFMDRTDDLGTDKAMKVWVIHPARTMGMEHLLKKAEKEFQTDFLLTWDKSSGQTLSYIINWTDRSSRYTSAYDAMVKVGVPMRTVQVDGMYSNTGRVQAAEGSLMWDAERDKNMKVAMKGQVDQRADTKKLDLGLRLPFIDKEYSMITETAVNSGSTLLDSRTEFSYSVDPRKLVVLTTRIEDISYGTDASNYSLAWGVVHPITDINIQMMAQVGNSQTLTDMQTKVIYQTADRQRKTVQLGSLLDKVARQTRIELKTPVKDLSLDGTLTGDQEYVLNLVCQEDGETSQITQVVINPDTKLFTLDFQYNKDSLGDSIGILGHMPYDNKLNIELFRMEDGGERRVSEGLLSVHLNSSHVLHTRVNWRPRMLADLQQYLGTQLTVFSYGSSEAFRAAAGSVGAEVEAKYEAIMNEVKEEAGPLLQHFQREIQSIQTHLDAMQRDIRRFYHSNSLNVKEMGDLANQAIESMVSGMERMLLQFKEIQFRIQRDITEAMARIGQYPMAQKYAQLVTEFASGLKNSRYVLEAALNEFSEQLGRFSDISYRRYLHISRQIERKLQGYTAALRQTPQYQQMAQAYGSAQAGLRQLSNGEYQQLADAANEKLLMALEKLGLKDVYLNVIAKSKQLIADQFHDLVGRPEFQQIYVIGNEIYQQGVWAYQYWHVEKNTRLAVAQLLELAKDVTLLEITRIKNAVVDLDKSRIIVFDPKNGELQFEIYLPVPLKSLVEPPDLRLTKYINRARSWAATYIPSPRHSLWTTINNYLPNMDYDTWLPPYTAHAYVMGDQHLVTFDGKHYNFAGRCSYILARDMLSDRFTVILNYNNRPRQPQVESIVILLRGVAIEVDKQNQIKVNDQARELPYFSDAISAVRKQSLIKIQDGEALTVEIDNFRDIYSVTISGWYHGKTAGLLGTYDNEPFNDFTNTRREITSDLEAFTNSWEVGRRYCRSRNLAESGELDEDSAELKECQRFLTHSSSYYSPCFGQVEASEIVQVCMAYIKSGLSIQDAKCKTGQHYRYICSRRGIALGTPAECVSCQLPGGSSLDPGHRQEVRTGDQSAAVSADVVFVVEESQCNEWARQSLPTLATQLDQALQANGLTNSRFGLVSYYGNGSTEQQLVHTIEGEVFGEPNNFLKASEGLRLTYPSSSADPTTALREAVKYPYRVGVAKLLVLLPCSTCAGDLFTLGQVLISHGFKLHVLNTQDFEVTGSDNFSPVRVFGVDNNNAYTQKSAARKSALIFDRLSSVNGGCADLALSTNGSVFDVSHMKQRRRIQDEFLKSFSTRGAVNAMPPSCQVCSCHDDGTGRGHTVCRVCNDNSWLWNHIPTWLQSSSNSVMGLFNDLHHQIVNSLQVSESDITVSAV